MKTHDVFDCLVIQKATSSISAASPSSLYSTAPSKAWLRVWLNLCDAHNYPANQYAFAFGMERSHFCRVARITRHREDIPAVTGGYHYLASSSEVNSCDAARMKRPYSSVARGGSAKCG